MKDRPLGVISSTVLAVCFLAILVLPILQNLFHFGPPVKLGEQRNLTEYPVFQWDLTAVSSYPSRFETAFNDHFGFRELLVRSQALAKYYWLHISPSPKVLVGRDEWLYLTASLPEYRGVSDLAYVKIRAWLQEFESKQAFLSARGIRYLIVVPPNKEGVYPEFLPESVSRVRNKIWLDQLLESLPAGHTLDILDLRGPLIASKKLGRLYHRTDSHWNEMGAARAVNTIIARLADWFPELQGREIKGTTESAWGRGGDLARLMGIQDYLREEYIIVPHSDRGLRPGAMRYDLPATAVQEQPVVLESTEPPNRLSVMLVGDSFKEAINQFLPAYFQRSLKLSPSVSNHAVFQEFLPSLIEAEKPDIYIEVIVDRNLANPPVTIFSAK
jgi:acetyltransferase AlgX (SGNH hydrolase-like protein)